MKIFVLAFGSVVNVYTVIIQDIKVVEPASFTIFLSYSACKLRYVCVTSF